MPHLIFPKFIIAFYLTSSAYALNVGVVPNTPENIARLANLGPNDHPEELSGQFQGDIVLNVEQANNLKRRTGLISKKYRWKNNLVPYKINRNHFKAKTVSLIENALKSIEAVSCIRFVRFNPHIHSDFVNVIGSGSGCWSMVGRQGGRQKLHLEVPGCDSHGIVIHEFIHALGFYHMQSSSDRDKYVKIIWKNIKKGEAYNFKIEHDITNFGLDYDYDSVMHYSSTAFSGNGKKTIVPILDPNAQIGNRKDMSAGDMERINRMYNCPVK